MNPRLSPIVVVVLCLLMLAVAAFADTPGANGVWLDERGGTFTLSQQGPRVSGRIIGSAAGGHAGLTGEFNGQFMGAQLQATIDAREPNVGQPNLTNWSKVNCRLTVTRDRITGPCSGSFHWEGQSRPFDYTLNLKRR